MIKIIQRTISDDFVRDLRNGILRPILDAVRRDSDLSLQIRDGYINVYYIGGNLVRIKPSRGAKYVGVMDAKYYPAGVADNVNDINSVADSKRIVDSFQMRKQLMDAKSKNKDEKRFQQKLCLQNSGKNNGGKFIVIDTEVQIPKKIADTIGGITRGHRPRFDMVAIAPMGNGKYRPILVENKYGNKCLWGTCGINVHLNDYGAFIRSKYWSKYLAELQAQALIMSELGMIKIPKKFEIDTCARPEVLFIIGMPDDNVRQTVAAELLPQPDILVTVKYFYDCVYDGTPDVEL